MNEGAFHMVNWFSLEKRKVRFAVRDPSANRFANHDEIRRLAVPRGDDA
jgi:hypothetical protein